MEISWLGSEAIILCTTISIFFLDLFLFFFLFLSLLPSLLLFFSAGSLFHGIHEIRFESETEKYDDVCRPLRQYLCATCTRL